MPFDLKARANVAVADVKLQQFVGTATRFRDDGRVRVFAEAFGDRYDDLREMAGQIKQHTLDHLDVYMERFVDQALPMRAAEIGLL